MISYNKRSKNSEDNLNIYIFRRNLSHTTNSYCPLKYQFALKLRMIETVLSGKYSLENIVVVFHN